MVGCLSGGIDNEHLLGIGYEEIGIGVFQPNYSGKRQLVFDRDHFHGWKSVSAQLQLPKVKLINLQTIVQFKYLHRFVTKKLCKISYNQFQGDVYKYRMSRWCTLFGEYPCPSEFRNPGSNQCLEKVRSICSKVSSSGYSSRSSFASSFSSGSFAGN